tara:strand:+ start:843 stop:2111 length:1269 start_codon:yes stop_codon:yes gene_type:complete
LIWRGYQWITWLLAPWALLCVVVRLYQEPLYRVHWRQRFGYDYPDKASNTLWFHAVSVGEVNLAATLIQSLKVDHPIVLTTTTLTGAERARVVLGDRVIHAYAPFDFKSVVMRFMKHFKPVALYLIETELWPHWIHCCEQQEIPVMLINGRLSDRSYRRYRLIRPLTQAMLSALSCLAVQSSLIGERFLKLGVSPDRVQVMNNIKYEIPMSPSDQALGLNLRQSLGGASRPCVIAASTHPGEEMMVLEAFVQLKSRTQDPCLILAPRHPIRVDDILKLCHQFNLKSARSTTISSDQLNSIEVLIVDTLGQLCQFYAASDIAFIGGSLIEHGGHNPIEAIQSSCACLSGPHVFNFEDMYEALFESGGCVRVEDSRALLQSWDHLIHTPEQQTQQVSDAQAVIRQTQGGLNQHLALIEALCSSD